MKTFSYCYRGAVVVVLMAACDPYDSQRGEFNAGPVDAANFPLDYKGSGGDPNVHGYTAGRGAFTAISAFVGGSAAPYYRFPFTAAQFAGSADSLRVLEDGKPYTPVPTPVAYVFDPAPPSPYPSSPTCSAPRNYAYDERTEDMRLDEQSSIFTQLPIAAQRPGVAATFTYVPVVQEVAVSASGMACQSIKSERTLKKAMGDSPAPPTGRYLLWAIIDPSAGVYRVGEQPNYPLPDGTYPNPRYGTGVGLQKWGWFGQYYLAYVDGGYIPLDPPATVTESGRSKQVVRMRPQRLYLPRTQVRRSATTDPVDSDIGQGYDVLQARRSDPGYSPVCEVWTYPVGPGASPPPVLISSLPNSESAILSNPFGAPTKGPPARTLNRTVPPYVYCPQVQ